jgi:hypothetical protein
MFAPSLFDATSASASSARVTISAVVVLPLVPVTSTTVRSRPSRRSTSGSSFNVTRPPITPPRPRPVARESRAVSRPVAMDMRVRKWVGDIRTRP